MTALAIFKLIISGFLFVGCHVFFGSSRSIVEELYAAATSGKFNSMAALGVLYTLLDALKYNPFGPENFWTPSLSQLTSLVLIPLVLAYHKMNVDKLTAFGVLVGVVSTLGAFSSVNGEISKYFCVAAHAVLRAYHSQELKRDEGVSLNYKNLVLNAASLGTCLFIYIAEVFGVLAMHQMPDKVSILPWVTIILIQSIVELGATAILKYSDVVVSEMAIVMSSLLTLFWTDSHDGVQLKLTSLFVAVLSLIQYFRAPVEEPETEFSAIPQDEEMEDLQRNDSTESVSLDDLNSNEPKPNGKNKEAPTTFLATKGSFLVVAATLLVIFAVFSKNSHLEGFAKDASNKKLIIPEDKLHGGISYKPSAYEKIAYDSDPFYDKHLSVVIESERNIPQLRNMFKTFEKYCTDCNKVRFLIVTCQEVAGEFEAYRTEFPFLKNMEIKTLQDVYPNVFNPDLGMDERLFRNSKGPNTASSMAKLEGCLNLGTTYCWILDPKSFMFKPTSIKQLVKHYLERPYILKSSYANIDYAPIKASLELLGYRERRGRVGESFAYFMEVNVLHRLHDIIHAKIRSIDAFPDTIFLENLYYAYIVHNLHLHPHYRVFDSSNVLGPFFPESVKLTDFEGPLEHASLAIGKNPALVFSIAERFSTYDIQFFRPTDGGQGTIAASAKFLDYAYSIQMCIGDQTEELIKMALDGRWVDRKNPFPPKPIRDGCINSDKDLDTTYCSNYK
ncbi:hypothetical protein HDU97_006909 [Phlyctochytrium planicorne]|nr:hypothetical protein HDU97_006909 [Phlyctochytrium planicorne]